MAAIAINVRRIFILLGVTLLITLGSTVLSLVVSTLGFNLESARVAVYVWGTFAVIVVVAGLWYAIKVKRITRP